MLFDAAHQHIQSDQIASAFGNDDMSVLLAGLYERFMHGFDGGQILVHNGVQCAVTLFDIADDAAKNTYVGVGVHENTDIHFIAQLLVSQNQNAFHDDDLCGLDGDKVLAAVMHSVVVHGALYGVACLQLLEMFDH